MAPSKADRAVNHILLRVIRDPRFADFMAHTESLDLLLEAQAEAIAVPFEDHKASYLPKVKVEDSRGAILAEDWENAAHKLLWESGQDEKFYELRDLAHQQADDRRAP